MTYAASIVQSPGLGLAETVRFPNLDTNPKLAELVSIIRAACSDNQLNTAVAEYVSFVVDTPLPNLVLEYYTEDTANFTSTHSLPSGFADLRDYKGAPGVYMYCTCAEHPDGDNYVGSTNDLWRRNFVEHKNNAFTTPTKHRHFYGTVNSQG